MEKKRLYNIDLVKGFLIIFVILGHFILGKVEDNIARYFIYSFHMPIFIAVSGFLINKKALANMTFWDVIKKYFPRLLIPWGAAVIVYAILVNYSEIPDLSIRETLNLFSQSFIKPYYHLWFILGFLSYIVIAWFLLKIRLKNWMIIIFAMVISFISKFELYHVNSVSLTNFLDTMHYDFRVYNFIFFILGMLLKEYIGRKRVPKLILNICVVLFVIAGFLCICLFYKDLSIGKKAMYFMFNIPLAVWLLSLSYKDYFPRCRWIEYIGQNSMAFYLWHVVAKLAADYFSDGNSKIYYWYSIVLLVILYVLIYFLSKINFINKYLFGALRKPNA